MNDDDDCLANYKFSPGAKYTLRDKTEANNKIHLVSPQKWVVLHCEAGDIFLWWLAIGFGVVLGISSYGFSVGSLWHYFNFLLLVVSVVIL